MKLLFYRSSFGIVIESAENCVLEHSQKTEFFCLLITAPVSFWVNLISFPVSVVGVSQILPKMDSLLISAF